jgi:AcrR family transcriptional regulator
VTATRPFRQQIDEGIVDRAAALFARRGFEQTSVQAIADAVGLSKAGLLHHFPSKDALREAVRAQVRGLGQQALDQVAGMPLGPGRDHRAVEVLVDVALAHPGLVALLLAPATQPGSDVCDPELGAAPAMAAFGVDPETTEPERLVRVVGALAALAVLALGAHQAGQTAAWRSHVIDTSFDALGHRRPGAARPDPDQVEA